MTEEQENLYYCTRANDLLPEIESIEDDPFNSDPHDLELMSKEVREKYKKKNHYLSLKKFRW